MLSVMRDWFGIAWSQCKVQTMCCCMFHWQFDSARVSERLSLSVLEDTVQEAWKLKWSFIQIQIIESGY